MRKIELGIGTEEGPAQVRLGLEDALGTIRLVATHSDEPGRLQTLARFEIGEGDENGRGQLTCELIPIASAGICYALGINQFDTMPITLINVAPKQPSADEALLHECFAALKTARDCQDDIAEGHAIYHNAAVSPAELRDMVAIDRDGTDAVIARLGKRLPVGEQPTIETEGGEFDGEGHPITIDLGLRFRNKGAIMRCARCGEINPEPFQHQCRCARCGATPIVATLDGDDLCQACCDEWARAEGIAAQERAVEP